jgi:hypothetical protein
LLPNQMRYQTALRPDGWNGAVLRLFGTCTQDANLQKPERTGHKVHRSPEIVPNKFSNSFTSGM